MADAWRIVFGVTREMRVSICGHLRLGAAF